MSKRKFIKVLKNEVGALTAELEQEREDYAHTHSTLWKMLQLLCDEFDVTLNAVPKSLLDDPEVYCTGDPCICQNGIGCVRVPVEEW